MRLKSNTLRNLYEKWQKVATAEQIKFVDAVFELCERNYDNGGDTIVECWEPSEILAEFSTLNDVKQFVGLQVENATNKRWGEDSDFELKVLRRFENEWQD